MKKNVGGIDKILRIGAGVGLVAWAALGGPAWAWIGVVPLHRPHRLLPGVPAAGHEQLPDPEGLIAFPASRNTAQPLPVSPIKNPEPKQVPDFLWLATRGRGLTSGRWLPAPEK